jgi:putative ABC transport system ATP-binding protein
MLSMQNVSMVYRTETVETHALRDFSLQVDEGEFVSVSGPSGSGKTTFLNIAGLLEEFSSGTYQLDGKDTSSLGDTERSRLRNEKIGFIFQSFNLIPELDIFDNVDVPLRYRGFSAAERKKRIDNVIDIVGLGSRKRGDCPGTGRRTAISPG